MDAGASGRDALEDERGGRGLLPADLPRALEGVQRPLEAGVIVPEQGEQGLTGGDRVSGLDVQVDAGGVQDRVLRAGATGSEPPCGDAEGQRVETRQDAGGRRRDRVRLAGGGESGIRVERVTVLPEEMARASFWMAPLTNRAKGVCKMASPLPIERLLPKGKPFFRQNSLSMSMATSFCRGSRKPQLTIR